VKNDVGKQGKQIEFIFGYKAHICLHAENGLIASVEVM
jgi:hypothetical protein